jgi:hypothetical protein
MSVGYVGAITMAYKVFRVGCGAIAIANGVLNKPELLMLPYIQSTDHLIY